CTTKHTFFHYTTLFRSERQYGDYTQYIEIAETVKYTIESLQDNKFFHLTGKGGKIYYRNGSKVPCKIDIFAVPFDITNVSTKLRSEEHTSELSHVKISY